MPENDCAWHTDFLESGGNKVSLRLRRPDGAPGPVAVAKSRTVDRDHAVVFGGQINQAAGLKVFDHAPVAVQQDQRGSCPAVDVVEPNAVHRDEPSEGRVSTLCFLGKPPIQQRGHPGGQENTGPDRKGVLRHSGSGQGARFGVRKMHGRTPRVWCTTARASEDVALRDNGQCNYSFLWPVDKNSHRTNDRFFVLGGPSDSKTRVGTTI